LSLWLLMNIESRIAELLDRFRNLCPDAEVEPFGPDSRSELTDILRVWIEHYPFIQGDSGYMAFLRSCAAACAFCGESNIHIEIVGVLGFEEQHLADVGFPTEPEGWYEIGWSSVYLGKIGDFHETIYHAYSFDATGKRPWGVYHSSRLAGGRAKRGHRLIASSFADFLEICTFRDFLINSLERSSLIVTALAG
jgi:hypothetical protein